MVDTIKNSFVPLNADGTAERIDQSLQDELDTEWYRREKLAPKGEAIPVIYGTMTVDGIDIFFKKHLYSKKRGNSWRGKWYEQKELVLAMQAFCYGGDYRIDEIKYPAGVSVGNRNEYDGKQTTPPKVIYKNRNSSTWHSYGWDTTSIGKGVVYCEFLGDHSRGFYTQEPVPTTITRLDVDNNHADVLVDYLTNTDYGVGWEVALLDLPSFNEAKKYLTTKNPLTGAPFLNCNYALDTSRSFKDNLKTILSECRGALIESNGKIKLIIERPVNTVINLDSSNIVGKIQTESLDISKRFNRVISKYFDETAKSASMVVFPQEYSQHETFLEEDNGVINQGELSLKTVTDRDQAFQQARIMCLQSRGGESLTVEVMGEATLLETFDVVGIHYPDLDLVPDANGLLPEYIVQEVQPDLEKQTAKIKLRFYDSSIYPVQGGRQDPPSPPRVPDEDDIGAVTFTEVIEKDNNKVFVRWDYVGDYAPNYLVSIFKDEVKEENLEYSTSTILDSVTTPPLVGGNYIIELTLVDRFNIEFLSATFTFTTNPPVAPLTVTTTATFDSVTVSPKLPSDTNASNLDFVYYAGVTDVEDDAFNYGSGETKQITGLKPETLYHIWVYTKSEFGLSKTPVYVTQETEAVPQNDFGGNRYEQRYKTSKDKPETPTGDFPIGWFTHPQTSSDPNWMSVALKKPDGTLVEGETWSEPVRYDSVGQFTWTAYADSPTGDGISLDPTGKTWIGTAYNQQEETPDITEPAIYEWRFIKPTHEESIYRMSDTKPDTPTGDEPTGWSSNPPVNPTTNVWVSVATKEVDGSLKGTWSEPAPFTGGDMLITEYQYSDDNGVSDPWDVGFVWGNIYRRERIARYPAGTKLPPTVTPIDASAWGAGYKFVPVKGIDYTDGQDGINQATIYLYYRSPTTPTVLPTGDVFYNFETHAITGGLGVWETSIPTGSDSIYLAQAIVSSRGNTGTIQVADWKVGLLQAASYNTTPVSLFQRSASIPSQPTGDTTYDFTTGQLTGALGSWTQTIPTGSDDLYVAVATAVSNTSTDVISSGEWTVALYEGAAQSHANVVIYKRSASNPPSRPSGDVTYTFATGDVVGLDNGWFTTPPSGSDTLFIGTGTAISSALTDTIRNSEWAITEFSANGDQAASVVLYKSAASKPSNSQLPRGNSTFNFATGKITFSDAQGWSLAPPTNTDGKIWTTHATASTKAPNQTDVIPESEWSEAELFAEAGYQSASVLLYKTSSVDLVAGDVPTNTNTFKFSTGKLTTTPNRDWKTEPPSNPNGLPIWFTSATASALTINDTDSILSSEWATPQKMAESGQDGLPGIPGTPGKDGSGWYTLQGHNGVFPSDATANQEFYNSFGRYPVNDDHLTYVDHLANPSRGENRRFNGTSWIVPALAIDGDAIINGTLSAKKIEGKSITADQIEAGTITADELDADCIYSRHIYSNQIYSNHIYSNQIYARHINSYQITAEKLNATALHLQGSNKSIKMGTAGNLVFHVDTNGKMTAKDALVTGTLEGGFVKGGHAGFGSGGSHNGYHTYIDGQGYLYTDRLRASGIQLDAIQGDISVGTSYRVTGSWIFPNTPISGWQQPETSNSLFAWYKKFPAYGRDHRIRISNLRVSRRGSAEGARAGNINIYLAVRRNNSGWYYKWISWGVYLGLSQSIELDTRFITNTLRANDTYEIRLFGEDAGRDGRFSNGNIFDFDIRPFEILQMN